MNNYYSKIVLACCTQDELEHELKIREALGEELPSERVELLKKFLKGPGKAGADTYKDRNAGKRGIVGVFQQGS